MAVVLLDLDDTLVPDVEARDRTLSQLLSEQGSDFTLDGALRVIRDLWRGTGLRAQPQLAGVSSWEALWTDFADFHALPEGARASGTDFQRQVWSTLGPGHDAELAAALFRTCREAAVAAYAWVDAALRSLGGARVLWCVTNGSSQLQRRKLQLARLERWFDRVFVSGELGAEKGSEPFARAVADSLIAAGDTAVAVIGDSPGSDGALADALGVTFVRVTPGAPWRRGPGSRNRGRYTL